MLDIAASLVIPGSDLHYAMLYVPVELRERLILISAVKAEIEAIPLMVSDRGVARVKLEWWRLEADRLEQGKPSHQLTQSCRDHAWANFEFCCAIRSLVAGLDDELSGQTRDKRTEQSMWYEQTYAPIYKFKANLQHSIEGDQLRNATDLGLCIEIVYSLLNLRSLALGGIRRISNESLVAARCSWDEIQSSKKSTGVVRLLESESKTVIDKIIALHASADRAAQRRHLALYTLSKIVLQAVLEMKNDGFRIWDHRIELTPIRKLWLAWRTRFI
jgi:phytoene synthase